MAVLVESQYKSNQGKYIVPALAKHKADLTPGIKISGSSINKRVRSTKSQAEKGNIIKSLDLRQRSNKQAQSKIRGYHMRIKCRKRLPQRNKTI